MVIGATTAALAIAGTAYAAHASAKAASAQNKAIGRSMESQQQAADIQKQQVENQAEVEKLKLANNAHQVQGRLRVAAADAGVGFGGSYSALSRQVAYDQALNLSIIDRNVALQDAAISTGLQANLESLASGGQNELLAAFVGGMGGFNAGLNIGQGIQSVGQLASTDRLSPYKPYAPPTLGVE